ncbi:MAG: universal stress protein [Saprospiraceae bacterium]
MIDIKIYGTGTPGQQLAKAKLVSVLQKAHIDFNVTEVNDISDFINDKVVSVPAIRVNNEDIYEIKPNGQYTQSLRDTIQSILRMESYGDLPQFIVPTDFSEPSMNAYNFANRLAKQMGGIIKLTHVYYPTSVDVNQYTILDNEVESIHKDRLDAYSKSLNQDWLGNFVIEPFIESEFRVGFPKLEIIEMSKTPESAVVMGTTGAGDTFKKVFGSLTMDLVDECYAPLYLIPPHATLSDNGNLTYLSDNIKNDSQHVLYAAHIAMLFGYHFKVLHYTKNDDTSFNVSDCKALLDNYFPNLTHSVEVQKTENVFEEIEKEASSPENAILAMSTKHRNIFQSIFHKSASEFAAMKAKVPLLILSDRVKTKLKV